ncbi:MAG: hypothetical protein WC326_00365 [Candidatus Delongbacteria bacterium]
MNPCKRPLVGLWLCLWLCVAGLPGRAQESPSLLVPVYDRFEDLGSLMTPTFIVELSGDHADARGELRFSVFHQGRQLRPQALKRVLFTLSADKPMFTRSMRAELVALVDGERIFFDEVELSGIEVPSQPVTRLDVWLPVESFRRLAHARSVECRVGRFDFSCPPELLEQLRHLALRL